MCFCWQSCETFVKTNNMWRIFLSRKCICYYNQYLLSCHRYIITISLITLNLVLKGFSKHLPNIENHPYIFILLWISIISIKQASYLQNKELFFDSITQHTLQETTRARSSAFAFSATLIQAISSVYWCIYPRTIIMLSLMILLVQNRTSSQLLLLLTYKKTYQSFLYFYFIIMFKMRRLLQ